jgi:hypothetical protein
MMGNVRHSITHSGRSTAVRAWAIQSAIFRDQYAKWHILHGWLWYLACRHSLRLPFLQFNNNARGLLSTAWAGCVIFAVRQHCQVGYSQQPGQGFSFFAVRRYCRVGASQHPGRDSSVSREEHGQQYNRQGRRGSLLPHMGASLGVLETGTRC